MKGLKYMKKIFLSMALLCGACVLNAADCVVCETVLEEDWVGCTGKGETRERAILRALKEGVSQVCGAKMTAEAGLYGGSVSETVRADGEKHTASATLKSFEERIAAETKGTVKGWTLVSEQQEGAFVKVHLHVKVMNPRSGVGRSVMLLPVKVPQSIQVSNVQFENGRRVSGADIGNEVGGSLRTYLAGERGFQIRTVDELSKALKMAKVDALLVGKGYASPTEAEEMGQMLTTDYLLFVELKDIVYRHKLKFDVKAGKAVPDDYFAITLALTLTNVKSGNVEGSAKVTSELLNEDIIKLRKKDKNVKLLDAAMGLFGDRIVEWTSDLVKTN